MAISILERDDFNNGKKYTQFKQKTAHFIGVVQPFSNFDTNLKMKEKMAF